MMDKCLIDHTNKKFQVFWSPSPERQEQIKRNVALMKKEQNLEYVYLSAEEVKQQYGYEGDQCLYDTVVMEYNQLHPDRLIMEMW